MSRRVIRHIRARCRDYSATKQQLAPSAAALGSPRRVRYEVRVANEGEWRNVTARMVGQLLNYCGIGFARHILILDQVGAC